MREVIFRNLITPASRKRDISVMETVERKGMLSTTLKRSTYFVRGVHRIKSKEELEEWVKRWKKDPSLNKKFFHILRKCSTKNKEDKLICKMRGFFHIIEGNAVYNVVFVHTLKIKMKRPE